MLHRRVIPVLLYSNGGLVKSNRFRDLAYIGDVINTVRTFNEKAVDEIALLDISATSSKRGPNYKLVEQVASECFMPLTYGGGITRTEEVGQLLNLGVEKVLINSAAANDPKLLKSVVSEIGSQSLVVGMDVKRSWLGDRVYVDRGRKNTGWDPVSYAKHVESLGCGEILLTSVDRDGTMSGYDIELVQTVADAVSIPVIACGGAGNLDDLSHLFQQSAAAAAAAGSLFVFYGKHRAVLITYPSPDQVRRIIGSNENNATSDG